jgi:hypothetical protein
MTPDPARRPLIKIKTPWKGCVDPVDYISEMKTVVLAIVLVTNGLVSTWSQEFSTIESKDGILFQTIQSFPLNDTLFVFFSTAGKKDFNSILILPDGTQKVIRLNELKEKAIAAITSTREHLHFYYFERGKDFVALNVLSLDKKTLKKTLLTPLSIPGRVIGYDVNDSLTVLSYDQKTSLLHLHRFKNFKLSFANQYAVNAHLFREKTTFISSSEITQPSDADSDIKVYLREKYLWIIAENNENKLMGTSTIFRIEILSGKSATMGIFEYSGNKWNTMLFGEEILKVVKSKGITLTAYAFQKNEPVFSVTYEEGSAISKERAYERRGVSNEAFSINIQQSLKAWGRPIVVPFSDGNSILLKIGNYEPKLNPKSPVPVLSSGVMKLIFEMTKIGSYAFNNKASDDRYFYLKGDFIKGFSYEPNPKAIEKVIDEFEITSWQKSMPLSGKGYVTSKDAAFGFYKFEKHYDQLKIVKFKRP